MKYWLSNIKDEHYANVLLLECLNTKVDYRQRSE